MACARSCASAGRPASCWRAGAPEASAGIAAARRTPSATGSTRSPTASASCRPATASMTTRPRSPAARCTGGWWPTGHSTPATPPRTAWACTTSTPACRRRSACWPASGRGGCSRTAAADTPRSQCRRDPSRFRPAKQSARPGNPGLAPYLESGLPDDPVAERNGDDLVGAREPEDAGETSNRQVIDVNVAELTRADGGGGPDRHLDRGRAAGGHVDRREAALADAVGQRPDVAGRGTHVAVERLSRDLHRSGGLRGRCARRRVRADLVRVQQPQARAELGCAHRQAGLVPGPDALEVGVAGEVLHVEVDWNGAGQTSGQLAAVGRHQVVGEGEPG